MSLIVCSERCVHQREGYCVLEHPCAIPNPQGPLENRCIYLELPPEEDAFGALSGPDAAQ